MPLFVAFGLGGLLWLGAAADLFWVTLIVVVAQGTLFGAVWWLRWVDRLRIAEQRLFDRRELGR